MRYRLIRSNTGSSSEYLVEPAMISLKCALAERELCFLSFDTRDVLTHGSSPNDSGGHDYDFRTQMSCSQSRDYVHQL